MSIEKATFPPCDLRLAGNADGTCARCNSPACIYYGCFVEPVRCQQCLDGSLHCDKPVRLRPRRKLPAVRRPASGDDTPPEPPSLVRRVFSYAEAIAQWTAAGRPERPDKEVEQIFHQHCKPCKWFDGDRKLCRGCGCRVASSGLALVNKIKMATEHCPRELW